MSGKPVLKWILCAALLLAGAPGCARYSLVETKPQSIGTAYSVTPQRAWSKRSDGHIELWTVDGPALEALRFFKGIADGQTLLGGPAAMPDGRKLPVYRTGMTPSGIVEFVVDSLARSGAGDLRASGLRPAAFGAAPGFRFELTLRSPDGLELDGMAAGAVLDGKLQLILFTGARIHYYALYRDEVERLFESVRTVSAERPARADSAAASAPLPAGARPPHAAPGS